MLDEAVLADTEKWNLEGLVWFQKGEAVALFGKWTRWGVLQVWHWFEGIVSVFGA